MKSLWFPLYTSDFLSSPDVQIMEAHEVGAYLLLLMHSWQSDKPGYLPNDEGRLRRATRLSVDAWKESGELLLSKWPVAEEASLRYNPRLLLEAGNAVELRKKKSDAGLKSAELKATRKAEAERLATERQQNASTIPTPVEKMANTRPTEGSTKFNQSQPQLQSSNEDDFAREASPPAAGLSEALKARLATLPDTSGEVPAAGGPLGKPARFEAICEELKLGPIDHEHYRAVALLAAKGKVRTDRQWESWIATFFTNRKDAGPLLTAKAAQLSTLTPRHELPAPGQEQQGQLIVIAGIDSDASMNRMQLDNARRKWPTATIHAFIPGQRHD